MPRRCEGWRRSRGVGRIPSYGSWQAARASAAALVLVASTAPTQAGAVADGAWCHDAQTLLVHGSAITLPSGKTVDGGCWPYFCEYTVPEGDPGAGDDVILSPHSERMILLERMTPEAKALMALPPPPETWLRCEPAS